jgi:hypothetical protein
MWYDTADSKMAQAGWESTFLLDESTEWFHWQANPDAKVPSVILYDHQGKAKAHGAETDDDDVLESAETEGWRKASWSVVRTLPFTTP